MCPTLHLYLHPSLHPPSGPGSQSSLGPRRLTYLFVPVFNVNLPLGETITEPAFQGFLSKGDVLTRIIMANNNPAIKSEPGNEAWDEERLEQSLNQLKLLHTQVGVPCSPARLQSN